MARYSDPARDVLTAAHEASKRIEELEQRVEDRDGVIESLEKRWRDHECEAS